MPNLLKLRKAKGIIKQACVDIIVLLTSGKKKETLQERQVAQWSESYENWLKDLNDKGCSIDSNLEWTGINLESQEGPWDLVAIGPKCLVERDLTVWLSPDVGADPKLTLEDNVFIGRNTYIGVFQPITIHSFAQIGAYCYIISANHRYESRDMPLRDQGFVGAPIIIGYDAWLGTHVVVLPGVTVGEGAIVAANSVVNKDIPPYEVWGGVPAKFIKVRPE